MSASAPDPAPARGWRAAGKPLALLALVALLTGFAATLIVRDGVNVPRWDEWTIVPLLTGSKALDWETLWARHAAHRFPLPRFLQIHFLRAFDHDLRAGMLLNLAVLATATSLLLGAARRLRGRWSWTDAVLPLALLHWGHTDNVLWSFQLSFVLSTLLIALLLTLFALRSARSGVLWQASVVGVLLLLPLVGGTGFVVAATFVPWLVVSGVAAWRTGERRGAALVGLGGALAVATLLALYARGMQSTVEGAQERDLFQVALSGARFLCNALGPVGRSLDPWSTGATVLAVVVAGLLLTRRAWRERGERSATIGLLGVLGALALTGLSIGWGRYGNDEYVAFALRYVTLAAPLVCVLQLACAAGRTSRAARATSLALLGLFAALLPWNTLAGTERSAEVAQRLRAFEVDAWSGLSTPELARRHAGLLFPNEEFLAARIRKMKRSGLAPFDRPLAERAGDLRSAYGRHFFTHGASPWLPVLLEDPPRLVLLAPAPHELELRVPAGRWTVRGAYGLRADAWEVGQSDGVNFRVEARTGRGKGDALLRARLDPVRRKEQRAPQTFELELEASEPTRIVFVTDPGPDGDSTSDWAYWSDLQVQPAD